VIYSAVHESGIVESVAVVDAPQMMYNLSVHLVANYFVSDGQWLVHNVDEIPIDVNLLKQFGVDVSQVNEVSNSFIRLTNPESYAEIGTIIGKFELIAFSQTLNGLKQLASNYDANRLILRVPDMVNPDLMSFIFRPRFLDKKDIQILQANIVAKPIDPSLIQIINQLDEETIYQTKSYKKAFSRGYQPRVDITLSCRI